MALTHQQNSMLQQGCEQLGLRLAPGQMELLTQYLLSLFKWNRAFNLTAIRDLDEMVVKHLLDSLALLPHLTGSNILDVGTGPGLPGIPGAICEPQRHWTLVDSNGKKTRFLVQMKAELKLENVSVVKGRIESLPATGLYDVITSRAFAALDSFVSVCLPLLSEHGEMLAMKGQIPAEEMAAVEQSGLDIQVTPLNVPYLHEERHLIVVKRQLEQ